MTQKSHSPGLSVPAKGPSLPHTCPAWAAENAVGFWNLPPGVEGSCPLQLPRIRLSCHLLCSTLIIPGSLQPGFSDLLNLFWAHFPWEGTKMSFRWCPTHIMTISGCSGTFTSFILCITLLVTQPKLQQDHTPVWGTLPASRAYQSVHHSPPLPYLQENFMDAEDYFHIYPR